MIINRQKALKLIGRNLQPKEIKKVHLSNFTVENIIPDEKKLLIFSMWEDNNIYGYEDAETEAAILEAEYPGKFVLIDTGDYITPLDWDSPGVETYDAIYSLFLVPKKWFGLREKNIIKYDQTWREFTQLLADGAINRKEYDIHISDLKDVGVRNVRVS